VSSTGTLRRREKGLDAITQHNNIVVLMIPDLVDVGGPWKVLPPGIHPATVEEVKSVFVINSVRERLFDGFVLGTTALALAGCRTVYLDGSFVTEKETPGDYDVSWDTTGVDVAKLDSVFLDFTDSRRFQKDKFLGEFFPESAAFAVLALFQIDKYTGARKGILKITLSAP